MRALAVVLLAAAAVAEPRDLRPREGSGWEGFRPGTSVKTKLSFQKPGQVPTAVVTITTLKAVAEDLLTLARERSDGLRPPERSETVVPRRGEAAPGEKAVVGDAKADRVRAAGREFACERRVTTITGPNGRRVVTEWIATDPRARVKRLARHYGKDGALEWHELHVLTDLETSRDVGGKPVRCQRYSVVQRVGSQERKGEVWLSRDVPGGLVLLELKAEEDGKELMTMREEAVAFGVR